jgi:ribosomal protein S18 acetylase RimI-like enzyme
LLWISNLVIEQRYRRQGLGSKLLKAAIQWAVERDIRQITLEAQTKNYPAISFAQKHGFQFCGYNERYYPNGDIALFFSRYL